MNEPDARLNYGDYFLYRLDGEIHNFSSAIFKLEIVLDFSKQDALKYLRILPNEDKLTNLITT